MEKDTQQNKSERAIQEEAVLAFWQSQNIFEKTMQKDAPSGDFIFYEGPPTANAKPALHHLEARAFKDVIPRYKTMKGYHVPRRAGWDTHGLPVELQIEKKLGFVSKKDIEEYGVAKFNKECKDSVFTYIKDWEDFTERIGYWVDKNDAYYTFDNSYVEALWGIVGKINDRGLLYKDYRVTPWCARCGTTLASHELAQGYMDVKDLSVYAKFRVRTEIGTFFQSSGRFAQPDIQKSTNLNALYILAWTTTPWTLPGNVVLVVGKDIDYVKIKVSEEYYILAQERLSVITEQYTIVESFKGQDLSGLEYEPLYPFLKNAVEVKGESLEKAFKVYTADFVTTTDGTGIVHIAPMYGADDFELGTKIGLPKLHTVNETGRFLENMDFLSGRFVKDEQVAIDIIKDLAHRGQLFKKQKYEHSYPHCWRCKTPLIYYARDSWYVRMSELRNYLLKANETINWEPEHIQEGRFGEWLREVKDWAFSRERYWGTPLPVWADREGKIEVVDSIGKLKSLTKSSGNKYFVMRHGQTGHNVRKEWNANRNISDPMTELGLSQVVETAKNFKGDLDMIITSPFSRTTETAKIFAQTKDLDIEIIQDERVREWEVGEVFNNKPFTEYFEIRNKSEDRYAFKAEDGESYSDILIRAGDFIYELEQKYKNKNILIITHGAVARALELHSHGISFAHLYNKTRDYKNFENGELREINFIPLPHNEKFELDLHKPYIDEIALEKNGKELKRVKEVIDVWFDSGSMPFAQDPQNIQYPADFISEAIDQTRGWFYTLLAVGVLMEKGTPYKNVICLGHLLDKEGKKMSKSIGNIVEPYEQINKFGVDAVRFWMYSVNQPGESKNYDEKSVAEINNKVFNLFGNVLSFYELYRDEEVESSIRQLEDESENVLDKWINARLNQLVSEVTSSLDNYDLFKPTRAIRDFIDDLSTWYLRRSRDRIRDADMQAKQTLYTVLKTTTQLMAPFAPFFAEYVWQKLKTSNDKESVHLSIWPRSVESEKLKVESIVEEMEVVRDVVTKGLELRQKAGIKIRQPLASLKVESGKLKEEYFYIVKDELNIKNITESEEMSLDTEITPELKKEGIARELMRAIQDMRKQKGLKPEDVIELIIETNTNGKEVIEKFENDIKKTVGASSIKIVENESQELITEEIPFNISF